MDVLLVIKKMATTIAEEIINIRRHLHQHPELSFEELNTSAFVCSILDKHAIEYSNGIVNTGIIALIKGNNPEKKTILLRADLDALPIEEKNEVIYKSKNVGVMHACGHDVHTASVLGTAIILNQLKHNFEGTIKIMFQPGEELLPGGSKLMIDAGVLKNPTVDSAFAQHVFPSMEVGKVGFRTGMYMASTDEIHINITGKGGHAAMAGDYNNPIIVAAHIITEIEKQFPYYINKDGVAKNKSNDIPTVIAFGKIVANGATNVIPESAYLAGTFRTMDEMWRKDVKDKIKTIAANIGIKYKVKTDISIVNGYPFLMNDVKTTENAKQAAIIYLGKENVEDLTLRMTAEDFAYITQSVPSCFYRLGTGNKSKGITSGVHTATFDIDENALQISTGLMAWIAFKELMIHH